MHKLNNLQASTSLLALELNQVMEYYKNYNITTICTDANNMLNKKLDKQHYTHARVISIVEHGNSVKIVYSYFKDIEDKV